ncbi:probable RNA-binding protein 46 [Portunus trituberculatus]|uniref:probable RNA-binding protein 46 n=1 Tax=Portunus trituberculatus TaxID=210409 RepID=UPI001E1CB2C8|nr:probable RNA-binding protein 46 [Portunus trituberculatus]
MTSGHDTASAAGTPQDLSPGLMQLLDRTKYPLVQENGQRRYGPPPGWEGSPPPEGCEVFVGRIPRDMFEDELVPVMERAGRLYDVRLMVDQVAGNRGFGFVQYCTLADAKNALRTLKEVEVRPGRSLSVSRSVDNKRLFVGGIPKTRTSQEVLEEMKRVTEGVVRVILYSCVQDKTKNRGYTFVEYTNHKAAAVARRKLFSGRLQLWGAEVKVDWAEPEHSVDDETMAKVTILYVRNLALRTTEQDILRMCEAFASDVTRVKKQQDYAFVHFSSRKNAECVKDALHGRVVDGCELEVSWAKPIKKEKKDKKFRSMMCELNGSQSAYLPHLSLAGEPMVVVPHVGKLGATQGMQHTAHHPITASAQHLEAALFNLHAPSFLPTDAHQLKPPTELVLPGYPNMAAPVMTEKMTQNTEDHRGGLQNSSPVSRVLPPSQALRGTPLAPQYFMATPQYYLPTQTMPHTAATPQAIPISSQPYLYPATPALTGYEGINPYLQAFYQHATLFTQPAVTTLDRQGQQRYATTE